MKELKDKIELIIEQSTSDRPACKNCVSYCNGNCMFGCVNERNSNGYKLNVGSVTTPEYSCSNFKSVYNFSGDVVDVLENIIKDIERVNDAKKNLSLLLEGKISESDFVDIMG